MIFYYNDSDDSILQIDDELSPEEIEKLSGLSLNSEIQNLLNLDIQNFNYYLFEEDLENISDKEFEFLFTNYFKDFLDEIEENYLTLNYEEHKTLFNETMDKKIYLKKNIFFLMNILPYDIFGKIIRHSEKYDIYPDNIDTTSLNINDFFKILDPDYNGKLINLKEIIIDEIQSKTKALENWFSKLGELSELSKKDTLEASLEILEEHITKQKIYNQIYIDIIKETPLEHLSQLFQKYLEKDYYNLI